MVITLHLSAPACLGFVLRRTKKWLRRPNLSVGFYFAPKFPQSSEKQKKKNYCGKKNAKKKNCHGEKINFNFAASYPQCDQLAREHVHKGAEPLLYPLHVPLATPGQQPTHIQPVEGTTKINDRQRFNKYLKNPDKNHRPTSE